MMTEEDLLRIESDISLLLRSFKLPDGLRLANLEGLGANLGEETGSNSNFNPGDANSVDGAAARDAAVHDAGEGSGVSKHFSDNIDASLTWAFVAWLRSVTSLPIFVKVILNCCSDSELFLAQLRHLQFLPFVEHVP